MESKATIKTRTSRRKADRFARLADRYGQTVSERLRRLIDSDLESHDAPKEGRP